MQPDFNRGVMTVCYRCHPVTAQGTSHDDWQLCERCQQRERRLTDDAIARATERLKELKRDEPARG